MVYNKIIYIYYLNNTYIKIRRVRQRIIVLSWAPEFYEAIETVVVCYANKYIFYSVRSRKCTYKYIVYCISKCLVLLAPLTSHQHLRIIFRSRYP